jgi:hypothetical protein
MPAETPARSYPSSPDSLFGSSQSSSSTMLNHWDLFANSKQNQQQGILRSSLKTRSSWPHSAIKAKRLVSFADDTEHPEKSQPGKDLGSKSPGQASRGKPPPSPPMEPRKGQHFDSDEERTSSAETTPQRRSASPTTTTTNRAMLNSSPHHGKSPATPRTTQSKSLDASTSGPLPVYKVFGNILEVSPALFWDNLSILM